MLVAGFVAPYLLDTTTRFVEAAAALPELLPIGAPRRDWRATLIADGMVIIRHPELSMALEIARRFAADLRLCAA